MEDKRIYSFRCSSFYKITFVSCILEAVLLLHVPGCFKAVLLSPVFILLANGCNVRVT